MPLRYIKKIVIISVSGSNGDSSLSDSFFLRVLNFWFMGGRVLSLLGCSYVPNGETHYCDFTPFQFGFRKSFGCSHAHHVLSRPIKDAVKTKMSLYCLTFDISGAFDNIVHSQALFYLASSGVNPSVLCLLSSWYSKSKIQVTWNGQISDPIKINKGVWQGAVLSPSIFKCVLASCLCPLKSSVFYGNIGLSSVAYADDVLLVARTRRGLLSNFTISTMNYLRLDC